MPPPETIMTNPVLAKLLAHNAGIEARKEEEAKAAFLAPYKAKSEAMRAAGPTKDCEQLSKHVTAIYHALKHECPAARLVPAEFYDTQSVGTYTIEEGKTEYMIHGSYGWRPAELQLPQKVTLCWKEQWTEVTRFRSKPNGKHTLHVGGYSRSEAVGSFQTLKDGSMKYYEIAQTIARCVRAKEGKAEHEAAKARLSSVVAAVSEKVGHQAYRGLSLTATADPEKPVSVRIDCTRAMSQEDAESLLSILKGYGIG
jgi:hypothetical protein